VAETGKGKKWVPVKPYTKQDGTKVPRHDRSTPDTSHGADPKKPKK
jgi:hypothetical protein